MMKRIRILCINPEEIFPNKEITYYTEEKKSADQEKKGKIFSFHQKCNEKNRKKCIPFRAG
jgi:hypothetical protein